MNDWYSLISEPKIENNHYNLSTRNGIENIRAISLLEIEQNPLISTRKMY